MALVPTRDERILQAARDVFLADPEAPVAAVAARAGVGISALYRRFESKEDLVRRVAGAGRHGRHRRLRIGQEDVAGGLQDALVAGRLEGHERHRSTGTFRSVTVRAQCWQLRAIRARNAAYGRCGAVSAARS